ncbi:MAG: hypothetical protein ABT940_04175 [Alphaproteobacteria bacterium]
MLTTRELARILLGLWWLLKFDVKGMALFDATARGVRRSFWAAWIVAPIYLMDSLLMFLAHPPSGGAWRFALARAVTYVLLWATWPVVALDLARWLGIRERWAGYIVVYNWFRVLESVVVLPMVVLQKTPIGHTPMLEGMFLTLMVMMIVYGWFIVRISLGVGAATAFALVIINTLLSDLIHIVGESLV